LLASSTETLALDTAGASFHAITVIEGQATVECGDQSVVLGRYETVIVPADAGLYAVRPLAPCRALLSRVP
jgi:mannose-6-phosphate isomerase